MTLKTLPKKIAVLMGGPESEREVSLRPGEGVANALRSYGAEVVEIDVRNEDFQLPNDVDLAFNTIHGTFGEDGHLQTILEGRGIAYTGDGVGASEIASTKFARKKNFRTRRNDPAIGSDPRGRAPYDSIADVGQGARQGSTGGVVIVKHESDLESALPKRRNMVANYRSKNSQPGGN